MLKQLIAEASALAGNVCLDQHNWVLYGGRPCPYGGTGNQGVYWCQNCGVYDYGKPGGPGFEDCQADGCNHCSNKPIDRMPDLE